MAHRIEPRPFVVCLTRDCGGHAEANGYCASCWDEETGKEVGVIEGVSLIIGVPCTALVLGIIAVFICGCIQYWIHGPGR